MDDLDEAEQDKHLHGKRDEREERVVVILLVELVLLLADGLLVAEVLHLDAVEVWHETHHDDAVPLAPEGEGQKDDLDYDREEEDGHPPAPREVIAGLHHIGKEVRECV